MKKRGNGRRGAGGLTLDGEKKAILELLNGEEDNHWQVGVHYNNIVDNDLAKEGGYRNAADFFNAEIGPGSAATLTHYGAVAKAFTEKVALQYKVSPLYALLIYVHLAELPVPSGDPGKVRVAVPTGKGGSTKSTPFAQCSRRDVEAAIAFLKKGDVSLPPDDKKLVARYQKAVDDMLGPHNYFKLRAELRGPQTWVNPGWMPLDELDAIAQTLTEVDPNPLRRGRGSRAEPRRRR